MFIVVEMYNFELCYNIQLEVYKRFGTLKVVYLIDNYALDTKKNVPIFFSISYSKPKPKKLIVPVHNEERSLSAIAVKNLNHGR